MAINPATSLEDPSYVDPSASSATGIIPMATSAISSALTPQNIGAGATIASGIQGNQVISDANKTLQAGLTTAENTVAAAGKPYMDTGAAANAQLATGLKAGGQFNTPFTMANAQNSDAMKTALTQGMTAIQNSAAAKGGLLGTNDMAALSDYGQQTGAQYQNQAFNQNLQQNAQAMGGLENLSGTGANTAGSVGTNVANLQASGAQAGMNATLGAVNNQNQTIANAISAYKSLGPTATTGTTGGGTGSNTVADVAKAISGISNGAGGTTGTGTVSGQPAGSVIDPTTGQPATTTPQQIATGTTTPTKTLDPAQSGAINAQNGSATPAGSTSAGTGVASGLNTGTTSAANPAAVTAAANDAVANGTPTTTPPTPADMTAWANQYGVTPTGITGLSVGDIAPLTGGLIVPGPLGLPMDTTTGMPVVPASAFDTFMSQIGLGSTPAVDLTSAVSPPLGAEFASLAPIDLTSLNLGATGSNFLTGLDTTAFAAPTPIDFTTPIAMDTTMPAIDPLANLPIP